MLTEDEYAEIGRKSEEDYYEKMGNIAEVEIKHLRQIAHDCYDTIFDSEIYILPNSELDKTNLIGSNHSKDIFDKFLQELVEDEDFRNTRSQLKHIEHEIHEPNGFKVFYKQDENNNGSIITVEVIKSLSEYIEKVGYNNNKENDKVFYRGHGKCTYKLTPSIYREDNLEILRNESNYIREIISSYPKYFKDCKTAIDYLSVLQHNGFPTRLLDFSENPLISLYMACDNNNDCASDVIRISIPEEYFKYYDSDTVSVLSNIAFAEDNFTSEQNNADDWIKKLVHLIRNEKPFFKSEINPEHLAGTIVFVKPKQDFERISRQSGLFALFGIDKTKNKMPKIEYLNPPCNIKHFIIPNECKKRILSELYFININEANVYCDLEHVAKYYVRKSREKEIGNYINDDEVKKQKEFENILSDILK